jgi:hypothetical protein
MASTDEETVMGEISAKTNRPHGNTVADRSSKSVQHRSGQATYSDIARCSYELYHAWFVPARVVVVELVALFQPQATIEGTILMLLFQAS